MMEATALAIAAWVRTEAEHKDYATACEWRAVADAIERNARDDEHRWLCEDCRCLNGRHESSCYRCGAGRNDT